MTPNGQTDPRISFTGVIAPNDAFEGSPVIYLFVFSESGERGRKANENWVRVALQIPTKATPEEVAAELEGVARQIRGGLQPGSRVGWNDDLFDETKLGEPA